MNNQFSLWQILPYFLILILCFIIFEMWQSSKTEIEYNKRNDSLETANIKLNHTKDSLTVEVIKGNSRIEINEAGTIQNRNIYIKEKERIVKQPYNRDYEELQEILK